MIRIPFSLPDVGLREIRGMVYIEDGFLVLKIKDALFGMVDTDQEVLKVEPGALEEVRIKKGVFLDRLVISPKKPDLLELVPGDHAMAVEARVRRKYRPELKRLVEEFRALQ